jgi:hypothetical protein
MFRTRKYLLCLLLVLTLIGSSVIAGDEESKSKASNVITRETVDWTLKSDQCKKLKEDLSGTGEKTGSTTTTTLEDGSTHKVEDVIIQGTASDSTGEYNFVYANHAVREIPPEGSKDPIKMFMVDTFYMHGTGKAELNESFIWSWTYTPPAEEWPPVDNWEKMHTVGDPITCDPL